MAESLQETRELKKLERAAEKTEQEITEPGSIEREAAVEAKKPAPLLWLLPYVVAALVVGAGIFACLSDAELGPLSATATDTLLRYLLGALGIIVVSAIARGIEVLVIERLPNPVSRFNLKRVLRL